MWRGKCVVSVCAVLVVVAHAATVEVGLDGQSVFGAGHEERQFGHFGQAGLKEEKANPRFACEEARLGHVRFQVLTSRVVRMEYYEDAAQDFNDLATFVVVNRALPCVDADITVGAHGVVIVTDHLRLEYTGDGKSKSGELSKTNLKITSTPFGDEVTWTPGKKNNRRLFGTIRTLDRVSGSFDLDCDALHIRSRHPHSPVAQHCTYGIVSRDGWTLIDDSKSPLFDASEWGWVSQLPNTSVRQDWYFMTYGLDYKQALYDFTRFAGNQPIPPRFSFGVFYSRWWPWADWESINIIKEYDTYSVPLDVLVTDMDWHRTCYREQDAGYVDLAGQPACWTGWTWDAKYFPNPKGFMDWCHVHGIKNTLNLHLASGVQPWEARFPQMAESMGLDPTAERVYVEWNVTDKRFSVNFHKHILAPMEEEGVDFWWLDWQQGEGWFKDTFPSLNPTFYLNYVFFTQPAKWGNGDRPLILHRWGGLGNHRYPVGFSGDVYPNWESLAYQPYMTRESANVLFGYWSHDIGGFMEPAADELYLRWIQYGVLSPIFRTHGTRLAENIKRMWYYKPEYFQAMRAAMQLRAKVLPYLYTAARRAYDTGISVCSPLYYEFPAWDDAYAHKTQYMFGSDIMVAPVVSPVDKDTQLASLDVLVPPGEWIEAMTGRVFTGPKVVTRSVALAEIPMYVRSGAVIVNRLLGPEEEKRDGISTGGWLGRAEEPIEGLEVNVYVPTDVEGGVEGSALVYEDAGNDVGYQSGEYAWRRIHYTLANDKLRLTIEAPRGNYPSMPQRMYYRIVLHGTVPPSSVSMGPGNDPVEYLPWQLFTPHTNKVSWSFDGNKMATLVNVYEWQEAGSAVEVEAVFDGNGDGLVRLSNAVRSQVEGLPGKIARAQVAKHTLDKSYPESAPSDYEGVTHFAEFGMRLSYAPHLIADELASLDANFEEAKQHAERFKKGFRREQSKGLEKVAKAHLRKL